MNSDTDSQCLDAVVANYVHNFMMPLTAVALNLLQMGGLPLRYIYYIIYISATVPEPAKARERS